MSAILVNPSGAGPNLPDPAAASAPEVAPAASVPAQRIAEAHARVRSLERAGAAADRVDALAQLARLWQAEGGLATAEAYLESALPWAELLGADAWLDLQTQRAELVMAQAELLERPDPSGASGAEPLPASVSAARHARERALGHVRAAARRAEQAACPAWEAQLLLRLSDLLDRGGQVDEAAALQWRALRLMGDKRNA